MGQVCELKLLIWKNDPLRNIALDIIMCFVYGQFVGLEGVNNSCGQVPHTGTMDRFVNIAWLCALCQKSDKGITDGTNVSSNLEMYTFKFFTWFIIKQTSYSFQMCSVVMVIKCFQSLLGCIQTKEYLYNSVTGKVGCVDSMTKFSWQHKILWAICIY